MRRLGLYTVLLLVANLLALFQGRSARRRVGSARPFRVGLVFDVGGRGDKSFNDSAYRGVERAVRELGVEAEYIEPSQGADRESGVRLLAAQKFDLILGVGFIFSDDLYQLAKIYPASHFACIDSAKFDAHGPVPPPPNMVGIKFREEEGAFLVGALAALTSKSGAVGFVGGMDIPLIRKFEAGFFAGVKEVCPTCRVLSGYAGVSDEAFKNPQKGKELALAQYGAGADVIFHAAGSTGLGVFEAARESGRFAIGDDSDQWEEAPGRILTSMIKQVDISVFETIRSLTQGSFTGGVRIFGLKEAGVDYVYDMHNRPFIPDEVRARIEELRRRIIGGEIKVPSEHT